MSVRLMIACSCLLLACSASTSAQQVDRKAKVENDRTRFQDSTTWVYNDLAEATAAARRLNRPLLCVLRCVP